LGSGVATYLAANLPVENVALITPYDSILNIAKANYSLFPVKLLLKDHYDSATRAKTIQSKVLVIAAEHDVVIPMLNTQNLVDAFRDDRVQLKVIKNTGHNDVSNSVEYFKALREFL
jgi:pimeloyl-ACP methyl ester carboxylesterase